MKLFRSFVMLGLVLPAAFAQYAGPAILSRGEAPAAMSLPKVDFSYSVSFTANYSNGLAGVSAPDVKGELANNSSVGAGITLGLSGAHSWQHTKLGINYSGGFTDYFNATYFAGLSQGLSLALTHQFSRRIGFSLRESAGLFSQFVPATVSLNSSIPFDPSQSGIPTTDFYDNRTIYNSTQGTLTLQKTSRLSFSIGGGYVTSIRRSAALYGTTGLSANGDVQYRLSRRTTIGANYSFSHYSYTHSIGGANAHSFGLDASVRLSKWTEFSLSGGATRVESSFQQTVPIDPAILAILCPSYVNTPCSLSAGVVNTHTQLWAPSFGIRVSRSFRTGVVYANAGESITPGNGLFLTSRSASASAGYGYSGLRNWSVNTGVSYTTSLSFGNISGNYGGTSGSIGMSRRIVKSLSAVASFNASHYNSSSFTAYNRLIYGLSVGLGFSPGNIPIRFF